MKKQCKEKLNSKVKIAINTMTKPHMITPTGPCRSYPSTGLYKIFKDYGEICPVVMDSTFSLPQKTVKEVKEEILLHYLNRKEEVLKVLKKR